MQGRATLDIRVHRKNMEVPHGLLEAAERKLAKLDALLDESGWVELGFVEEQNPRIADKYHCEIVAHLKGHRLKVEASAGEPFGALDQAAQKVDRQVRKLKGKRVDRRRRANNHLAGDPGEVGNLAVPPVEPGAEGAEADDRPPRIVAMEQADAKPMAPLEAAMQLDVLGQDFLLFVNAETDRAAVIYRRRDGDYGLIEAPG